MVTTTGPTSEDGRERLADDELCRIIRGGETWPLDLLWRRHGPTARAWAMKKDPTAAEDVVAESFTLVFQTLLGGGGPTESFRGYLYKTMESVFAKHWRAQRRTTRLEDLESLAEDDGELPDALLREEREAAAVALTELPDRWRRVIVAVDLEGRPVQEVAEDLQLSPNSASALLKRAREGLRKGWMQHLHRPSSTLPAGCVQTVKHFGILRWGKRGTRRRAEAETHLEGCGACRTRYAQFLEQASAVGLGLAGVIALTREWREKLIPSLATSAAVAASFSVTVTVVPPAFDPPPPPPTTTETVEPSATTGADVGGDPAVGTGDRDPSGEEPEVDSNVDGTLTEDAEDEDSGSRPDGGGAELLYFGDWSGWDEDASRFRRAP
ncbi:sigma-70 family RNA polymerase sigma factor [Leucobacter sp. CSA1]|uniref:Sigma-70 family RNA polymerase sigma factor n=1 Tax=Leucobacter chromiisoli TaxID=2796471 RepID=A0A934Q621_9MICO|nr:sigma-70 family RNA polymerase sigma factor [Leucobacter chromiisoli]MBK0418964.1 sigma-70 family RNA polymerase sigma factor [Leucobacter chromiisoli]